MHDTIESISEKIDALSLFPAEAKRPYVISTPPYLRTSAGVKGLHLLCHCLNTLGHESYVTSDVTNPNLFTPVVSNDLLDAWHERGITPIVVYPEVIPGNPYGASCVVRYLLNYPGLLGGDSEFNAGEFYVSYAKGMNPWTKPEEELVLHIPLADNTVFHPSGDNTVRSGTCYYAAKYKDFHHAKTFPITDNSVEITREKPGSQEPPEIAELFRKSKYFYAYENTTLSVEARLCGCPVILLPNEYFTKVIAREEIGMDGMAWGTDESEIKRAEETLPKFLEDYAKTLEKFWEQLEDFVRKTQEHATGKTQATRLNLGIGDEYTIKPGFPKKKLARYAVRTYVLIRMMFSRDGVKHREGLKKAIGKRGLISGLKRYVKDLYIERYYLNLVKALGVTPKMVTGREKLYKFKNYLAPGYKGKN